MISNLLIAQLVGSQILIWNNPIILLLILLALFCKKHDSHKWQYNYNKEHMKKMPDNAYRVLYALYIYSMMLVWNGPSLDIPTMMLALDWLLLSAVWFVCKDLQALQQPNNLTLKNTLGKTLIKHIHSFKNSLSYNSPTKRTLRCQYVYATIYNFYPTIFYRVNLCITLHHYKLQYVFYLLYLHIFYIYLNENGLISVIYLQWKKKLNIIYLSSGQIISYPKWNAIMKNIEL